MEKRTNESSNQVSREIPLKRALGLVQVVLIGVGTAICGTMFAIMGRAVEAAGPSIVLTFLIGAFFALFHGINYAELGSSISSSAGGAISFVRRAFGEGTSAFLTGWFDWIGSITDCSVGAIVFAFSVNYFFRWVEPFALAAITLICFALINFKGARTMGNAEFILTAILIFSLCFFIIGSSFNFEPRNLTPLFPKGPLPTLLMVSYIFPTYAGYETITQLSEEVKIAGKTIPRALFLTLALITLLFVGSAIATVSSAPREVYAGSDTPLQDAAGYVLGPIGGMIVSFGIIIATLSTINGSMAGGTRIVYALGRGNLLPSFLKKVHPKHRSPYTSLALTTAVAIIFVLTRSVDFIVYVIALGYNITAIMVALALIRLRKTEPQLYRPFKAPLYPCTPIISILVSVFMILTISIESLILGLIFGLSGIGLMMFVRKSIRQS